MIKLVPCFVCAFFGALMLAVPNMTRRGVLFAVAVPPGFRDGPEGRRSLLAYRTLVGIAVSIALLALVFSPKDSLGAFTVAGPPLILCAGAWGFLRQKRSISRFAVHPRRLPVREVELSGDLDRIPWFAWLGAVPFAILAAAAAFLYWNWDRIPARFPVHWDVYGEPNRWVERTTRGVYGPLIFAAEFCAFMLALALAGWFGARRSPMRRIILGAAIAVQSALGLLFAGIAVNPIAHLPVWFIVLGPVFVMGIIVFLAIHRASGVNDTAEPAPEECWHGSVIYYNPGDPALLVEKRVGFGYTLNFGNHWSWVLAAGLVLIIVSARPLLL